MLPVSLVTYLMFLSTTGKLQLFCSLNIYAAARGNQLFPSLTSAVGSAKVIWSRVSWYFCAVKKTTGLVHQRAFEWFIDDQAFLPSYDLAPPPPPTPPPSGNAQKDWDWETASWIERERGGGGAESYDSEKDWSSITHSILFVVNLWQCRHCRYPLSQSTIRMHNDYRLMYCKHRLST